MVNKDLVIAALSQVKLCDDCLSVSSGVHPRNQVYSICTSLASSNIIIRRYGKCEHCHKNKNTSRLIDFTEESMPTSIIEGHVTLQSKPWYWEGNIQSQVVNFLVHNNYKIQSVADTAARTSGVDIIGLSPDNNELWISVKGYPEKSKHVQARHWFSGAIFDLILYHGENTNNKLAIALPDGFTTYKNLLPRINWLKESMPFHIYWVKENGEVRIE